MTPTFMRAASALLLAILAAPAAADNPPRVPTERACQYLADYALVARALAEENSLSTGQADAILKRIYQLNHPLIVDVENRLRSAARGDKRNAQQFSREFLRECVSKEGDLRGFLGVSL